MDEKAEIRYARLRRRETTQKRARTASTTTMIQKMVIPTVLSKSGSLILA
jgi:hypothetical protein